MKILAIYFSSGSGISIIYERIFCELAKSATVDVLSDFEPKPHLDKYVRKQYHLPYTQRMHSWYRKCVRWFGATPISNRWSKRAATMVGEDYDVVIAFTASSQLTPVIAGRIIAQRLQCKLAVYSVDAIPAPGGWTMPREYYGKLRVVARNFCAADYVASSNRHMLEFQLTTFKHKPNLQTGVLLTPSPNELYNNPISNETLLLYTGTLYGLRNPDHFLKAFKRLLKERPEAQFLLVGKMMKMKHIKSILTPEEREHIHFADHTNDLNPLFSRAKVLVDIDADRERDPFLSSKIVTYLKVNRMIICETGHDTPSREMFAGYKTIIQCDHNEESLYQGMVKALAMAESEQDYSERKPLIEQFSIEHVCDIFRNDLERLCSRQ